MNAGVFCTLEDLEGMWTLPDQFLVEPEFPEFICEDATSGSGQLNNVLYFGFVPNSNTVTLQINPIVCSPGNETPGFHWGIIEGCKLVNPHFIVCDGDQQNSQVTITSGDFVPGTTYYLMVDGWAGSVCTFNIDVLTGIPSSANPFEVEELTHFSNDLYPFIADGDTIDFCLNGTLTTQVHGSANNNGYVWSSPVLNGPGPIVHPTDADTLRWTFTEADSVYRFCTYAITDCDDSEEICFYVNVTEMPDDSLGVFEYCAADLTTGVVPDGWECDPIKTAGTHYCTLTDTITGCTQLQVVKVIRNEISIETKDTLICGEEPLYYNGDTIFGDFFDKDYLFEDASVNGCDSLVKFSVERVRFYGTVSELSCLNDEEFGIEVLIDSLFPGDYESIVVDWFKDDIHYQTGGMNELTLTVSDKGRYSALVTVYKNGEACQFDLNEIEIDRFITADFLPSATAICVDDTLTVTLDAFNISATYTWSSGDEVIQVFPGVYQIIWDDAGVYDLGLNVDFDGCKVNSDVVQITVESLLEKPEIECLHTTNDSIYVAWTPVDCSSGYEVWLDGNLIITTNVPKFEFGNLDQGTTYEIAIVALSECLCPSTGDTTFCETEICPDDIELLFDQLPMAVCTEDMTEDLQLSVQVNNSSGGTLEWISGITDSDGLIRADLFNPGIYPVSVNYTIDNCSYNLTDTFTVYPPVEMDVSWQDISCYYNQDGEISITPMQGTAPFTVILNGQPLSGLDTFQLEEGIYNLEILDANLCSNTTEVEIIRPAKPDLSIIGDTFIERGQTYDYRLTLDNIDYDSVVWFVPSLDTVLCAGICDEITYAPIFNQDLCIELFYDETCRIDTCIHLTVHYDTKVFIPNVFTPGHQDGMNDFFTLKTNSYESIRVVNFSIFDRWGEMVFHKSNEFISRSTDESFGWDGRIRGSAAATGVYIYLIEVEGTDGSIQQFVGDLTLIR
jgi:gliding motility-associated-like protein